MARRKSSDEMDSAESYVSELSYSLNKSATATQPSTKSCLVLILENQLRTAAIGAARLSKIIEDVCAITPTSVYLFKNQKGEPLVKNRKTNSAFNSAWRRWMKRLKDRDIQTFSERSLRNLVGSEDDLQTASERLGHSSTSTTQQYYRKKPTVVLPLSPGSK